MSNSIPHGARSTANQVLAGVDLTRKWILVTGCDEEIGFETMNALAANGAHVFGLASSLAGAKNACDQIGPRATPVQCDLADLDSVAAKPRRSEAFTFHSMRSLPIRRWKVADAAHEIWSRTSDTISNHIGPFALVNQLLERVRNGTGRIVIVSSSASVMRAVRSRVQQFMKSAGQRAATAALLAASPQVMGITGEYWTVKLPRVIRC